MPDEKKAEAERFVSPNEVKAREGAKVVFPIAQEEQMAVKHAIRERRIVERSRRRDDDDY